MSLGKPKSSASSSAAVPKKGVDRASASNGGIGSKRSAIGVAHEEDDGEEGRGKRVYVTGIGEGKVVTKEVVVERGPLVISLASNPWEKGTAKSGANGSSAGPAGAASPAAAAESAAEASEPAPEKSLDELAAEAIVQESRRGDGRGDGGAADGYGLGLVSDRVIGMVGKDGSGGQEPASTSAGNGDRSGGGGGGKKRTGLLEQNMIPGLKEVDGEDAKFKHDLGHRAEDVSARSQAYVNVPIAEFGAALLRGMGWRGPEGDGGGGGGSGGNGPDLSREIEPRHHRLGLGAQPKPPEEVRGRGRGKRLPHCVQIRRAEETAAEDRSGSVRSGGSRPCLVSVSTYADDLGTQNPTTSQKLRRNAGHTHTRRGLERRTAPI